MFVTIKHFGSTFSRFFSEKRKISNKITLVDDNDTIVSDDQSISEELNTFFKNNTKSLNYTAKLLPNR